MTLNVAFRFYYRKEPSDIMEGAYNRRHLSFNAVTFFLLLSLYYFHSCTRPPETILPGIHQSINNYKNESQIVSYFQLIKLCTPVSIIIFCFEKLFCGDFANWSKKIFTT